MMKQQKAGGVFHTYSRKINNGILNFSRRNDSIIDLNSQSIWDFDGRGIDGKFKGVSLDKIKSYQIEISVSLTPARVPP
jgi:hypothetical protein